MLRKLLCFGLSPYRGMRLGARLSMSLGLSLSLGLGLLSSAEIERSATSLDVRLSESVHLSFALDNERLLGLATADVHGVATTAADTVFRPYLAEDMFGEPRFTHALRLVRIEEHAKGITLVLDAHASGTREALDLFYVMTPDGSSQADNQSLAKLRSKAEEARATIRRLILASHKGAKKAQAQLAEHLATPIPENQQEQQIYTVRTSFYSDRVDSQINKALRKSHKDDPAILAAQADVAAYDAALLKTAVAGNNKRIHVDYFGQAIPQLPAESAQRAQQSKLAAVSGEKVGTIRWTFTPEQVNIAGWDWQGWSHQISYEGIEGSPTFRVLRNQGTWELGGQAVGSTVVAMRYRGLGSIEETFEDNGNGGVHTAFTTTEIIPGAVGGTPIISPAIPESVEVGDRGYGL